ncbi:MAG: hypothetical protein ACFB9M_06900 [Myxococcota bacterium]
MDLRPAQAAPLGDGFCTGNQVGAAGSGQLGGQAEAMGPVETELEIRGATQSLPLRGTPQLDPWSPILRSSPPVMQVQAQQLQAGRGGSRDHAMYIPPFTWRT